MNSAFWYLLVPVGSLVSILNFYYLPPKKSAAAQALLLATAALGLFFSPRLCLPILIQLGGAAAFFLLFRRHESARIEKQSRESGKVLKLEQAEREKNERLKSEWSRSERDTVRTLHLYGTMKGLGEALTWDEMVPHIDYAVQKGLGFKEYQLYLLDENEAYQKMITRGFKLQDPPLKALAASPQWHEQHPDIYVEIPIRQGESGIGLLWVRAAANAGVFTEMVKRKNDLLRECLDFADGLAMGLQKARLFSSIEKLSRIDGLTGVHRRQVFNDHLEEEIRRSQAFRTGFSVLIADLDHFKHINDTYGHQAGDEVLRRVGQLFKESVYETDFVARYGGEEFVILFPQADPVGVLRKAEALRQRVAGQEFNFGLNKIRMTVSMGIAHFPSDGQDPAGLLHAADQRLYQAKEGGRNRIVSP